LRRDLPARSRGGLSRWWWTQSDQAGLREPNSLLTGKRTGENEICGRFRSSAVQISWIDQQLTKTIPYAAEQGIKFVVQGRIERQGCEQGKLLTTAFAAHVREIGVSQAQVERGCHGALGAMIVVTRMAARRAPGRRVFAPDEGGGDAIGR
jgi:hypothetical protein